jgi:hypothetical protein
MLFVPLTCEKSSVNEPNSPTIVAQQAVPDYLWVMPTPYCPDRLTLLQFRFNMKSKKWDAASKVYHIEQKSFGEGGHRR